MGASGGTGGGGGVVGASVGVGNGGCGDGGVAYVKLDTSIFHFFIGKKVLDMVKEQQVVIV